jgi:hypothetical protein
MSPPHTKRKPPLVPILLLVAATPLLALPLQLPPASREAALNLIDSDGVGGLNHRPLLVYCPDELEELFPTAVDGGRHVGAGNGGNGDPVDGLAGVADVLEATGLAARAGGEGMSFGGIPGDGAGEGVVNGEGGVVGSIGEAGEGAAVEGRGEPEGGRSEAKIESFLLLTQYQSPKTSPWLSR